MSTAQSYQRMEITLSKTVKDVISDKPIIPCDFDSLQDVIDFAEQEDTSPTFRGGLNNCFSFIELVEKSKRETGEEMTKETLAACWVNSDDGDIGFEGTALASIIAKTFWLDYAKYHEQGIAPF